MAIRDYWYASGTPTYLAKLMEGHHVNIQKLLSKQYRSKYFVDYRADTEAPLAMFYQSGYLTIKDYDRRDNLYTLDFPNDEVRSGFSTLIEKQNSHGRADIIIESDEDIYIFEFKVDKPADEALAQIEEKGYAMPYAEGSKPVHKIGVSISSKTRTVAEWKCI